MNQIIETPEVADEKKDSGFTLVELLIVIVILGILAAVTVFAVSGITDQAGENACALEARTLETAQAAYEVVTGTVDASPAELVTAGYLTSLPSPQC